MTPGISGTHDWHRWVAMFVAIGGLALGVVQIWPHPKPPPRPRPMAEQARPSLQLLQSANQDLTDGLNGLKVTDAGRLAMSRSDFAMTALGDARAKLRTLHANADRDKQFAQAAQSVFHNEHSYLRTVRAFLRGKPSKPAQQSFWDVSEGLRRSLQILATYTPAVNARSVGGGAVLAEWLHQKTGQGTAIRKFPPPQRSDAEDKLPAVSVTPVPPACANGTDDDGDGKTDYPDDTDCASKDGTSEGAPAIPADCANGSDDDSDGLIDAADPGCSLGDKEHEAAG